MKARYKGIVDRYAGLIRSAQIPAGTRLPTHRTGTYLPCHRDAGLCRAREDGVGQRRNRTRNLRQGDPVAVGSGDRSACGRHRCTGSELQLSRPAGPGGAAAGGAQAGRLRGRYRIAPALSAPCRQADRAGDYRRAPRGGAFSTHRGQRADRKRCPAWPDHNGDGSAPARRRGGSRRPHLPGL